MSAVAERFAAETASHHMTVLHDDGPYRHLRFINSHLCNDAEYRPTTGMYWFDLVTWPGALVVNGDCGTFTFTRDPDMFAFFRGHRINPQYWAEKVRGETRTKVYSEDVFRQAVKEAAAEAIRGGYAPKGLARAVRDEILSNDDIGGEDDARRALDAFEHGATYAMACSCGKKVDGLTDTEAHDWRVRHALTTTASDPHTLTTDRTEGFRFCDTWEWDLCDWDWQFLWCLHAIVWGIAEYDGQHAAAAA